MLLPNPDPELSPLDQIRQTEAEITRHIAAARQAAERSLEMARKDAARLKSQARQDGECEGQVRYQEILQGAEGEAKGILVKANRWAEELAHKGGLRLEQAIQEGLQIVLELQEDEEEP